MPNKINKEIRHQNKTKRKQERKEGEKTMRRVKHER